MKTATMAGAALVAALGALALAACGGGSAATPSASALRVSTAAATTPGAPAGPTITVSGHGDIEGTPDTMTVMMGVQTGDQSAQSALEHNNSRAQAMIDALKSHGVADKDIQTTDLSVSPNYDNQGHVTGYIAANTVTAKLHDLSKAGAVIDAAAATAGNDIRLQGISFSIDDTSALVAQARTKAVKDALAQAHQLADAAGVKVGAIRSIDDTNSQVITPTPYATFGAARAAADSVPVQAGTQKLSVDVSVVVDIAS